MNVWVIVALYWIVCCVLVYVLANINGQAAYRKMMKQKTTFGSICSSSYLAHWQLLLCYLS